jgi:phenylacetate-CoA ligase
VLDRDGQLDAMTVVVERRESVPDERAPESAAALTQLVKSSIGVTVAVDVVPPDSVERSVGKMRRIVDNRPKR